MRVILIIFLLLAAAAAGGVFYLANYADAHAPAPHQGEVEIDVELPV